ncbi:hypothetical protein ACIRVF_24030 [Kitasatospora sp. NPDC101157]|uniref:hypothetical protein n=1 Tax=Kitasatospora sp. NPDC101157 TaxID=3364098 RepID=UPI00381CBFAA
MVLAVSWGLVVALLGALVARLVRDIAATDDGEAQFAGGILVVVWGAAIVFSFLPAAMSTAAAVSLRRRHAGARSMIGASGVVTVLSVLASMAAPRWLLPENAFLAVGQVALCVLGVSSALLSRSREVVEYLGVTHGRVVVR